MVWCKCVRALGTIAPANRSNTLRIVCGSLLDWFGSVSFQRHSRNSIWLLKWSWRAVESLWMTVSFIEVEKESCKKCTRTQYTCAMSNWMMNERVASTLAPNLHTTSTTQKKWRTFLSITYVRHPIFSRRRISEKWRNAFAIQYVRDVCVDYGIGYCTHMHVITTTNFVNMAQSIRALKLIFMSRPNLRPSLWSVRTVQQYQHQHRGLWHRFNSYNSISCCCLLNYAKIQANVLRESEREKNVEKYDY